MSKRKGGRSEEDKLSKHKTVSEYLGVGSRFATLLEELIDEFDGSARMGSLIMRFASYEMGGPADVIEIRQKKDGKIIALASHPGTDKKKKFKHRDTLKPVLAVNMEAGLFALTNLHELFQQIRNGGVEIDHKHLQKQLGRPALVVIGKTMNWGVKK